MYEQPSIRLLLQALSWSNESEAVELLKEWASGMARALLTESAQAALDVLESAP
jgi:hypothetical protein